MKANRSFTSAMGPTIIRYLALKRALGRGYTIEEAVLRSVDAFLTRGPTPGLDLTSETFASWCQTFLHLVPTIRRNRMRITRNFCLYRRRTESACFVPDLTLFPAPRPPERPYIFTRAEVARLLQAAGLLERTDGAPLRPEIFRLAVTLLYTTGLRRGELLHLTLTDYDPHDRVLFVRQTKFHKSRHLPLSTDGFQEIEAYLRVRQARQITMAPEAPLLWNAYKGGRSYTGTGLADGLRILLRATDIRRPDGRLPRVHDFRHTFAVHALVRWYRSGADVQAKLPLLATYMGHVSIVSTEYYLQFIEDLAMSASARFARHYPELSNPPPRQKGIDR